jgi:hypothetical protein
MRLPRMTMWRWIIVVVVVGLMIGGWVCWLKQRRDYFLSLAQSHQNEVASSTARGKALQSRFVGTPGMTSEEMIHLQRDYNLMLDRADHHASLARKYERAASRPWLSIEPDPPEP